MESTTPKTGKLVVSDRDVALAMIYGIPNIIIIRHQVADNFQAAGTLIHVYSVQK